MDIYRKTTGQCKLVNDWISSDKYNILRYEQLEQYMIQAQEPVVRFAVQYNGVDRGRYEKAILAAEKPLMDCVKSNEKVNLHVGHAQHLLRRFVPVFCTVLR